ncbi:MAG: RlmE family RNA methyltransferase [Burkholderiaceae bacterium]|nr:RlmE family RNA methyltransferase [Burkholderiaceae bacterium]
MAKNKFNKSWMNRHLRDPYVRQAQKEKYRSRAAYKLKEIDSAHQILKSGQLVVELGISPGSWAQYAVRKLGYDTQGKVKGELIGIDMLPMENIPGVVFLLGDFTEEASLQQLLDKLGGRKVDVILSDMAPNLSGIAAVDGARMAHLLDRVLEFSRQCLKDSGAVLAKCFDGAAYNEMLVQCRAQFRSVARQKPDASREHSAEVYLLCKGLLPGAQALENE